MLNGVWGNFLNNMGRRKQDKLDELERLEEEIKLLKCENRHLKKELKRSNKRYKPEHDQDQLISEDYSPKKEMCPECGKGEIITTDLGVRKLIHCTVCKNRRTLKTNGKTEES